MFGSASLFGSKVGKQRVKLLDETYTITCQLFHPSASISESASVEFRPLKPVEVAAVPFEDVKDVARVLGSADTDVGGPGQADHKM